MIIVITINTVAIWFIITIFIIIVVVDFTFAIMIINNVIICNIIVFILY